jgi:hypothetical protein
MRTRTLRSAAGFTLIEALVVGVMFSLLMAALYSFYRAQVFALRTEETKLNVKETSDTGLEFIVRELRMAGARPAPYPAGCSVAAVTTIPCTGFADLTQARTNQLTLQFDHRGNTSGSSADGCPDDAGERITYRYDAVDDAIKRDASDGLGEQIVARAIPDGGLTFRYFTAAGAELVPGTSGLTQDERLTVDRIVVSVTASESNPDPRVGGSLQSSKSSTVYLRSPHC